MKKRRCIIAACVLAVLVGMGLFVDSLLPPSPGVTRANFDRIEDGMKFKDVEAIFGSKPAQISGPLEWELGPDAGEQREYATIIWTDGRGEAFINFDKAGHVMSCEWRSWSRRKMEEFRRWVFPI